MDNGFAELNESFDLHCPEILDGKDTYVRDFETEEADGFKFRI